MRGRKNGGISWNMLAEIAEIWKGNGEKEGDRRRQIAGLGEIVTTV